MHVNVLVEDARWSGVGIDSIAATACEAALTHLIGPSEAEVSVLACGDKRIAELNADFRGKPKPTNVLSWPSEERGAPDDGGLPDLALGQDPEIGDLAIAYETCLGEATVAGRTMADHVTHLLVHGTLHLMGYDHERDADADLMEQLEVEILGKLGIANPY